MSKSHNHKNQIQNTQPPNEDQLLKTPSQERLVPQKVGSYAGEFIEAQIDILFKEGYGALPKLREELMQYVLLGAIMRLDRKLREIYE